MTIKIKDERAKAFRTMVRQFKRLGARPWQQLKNERDIEEKTDSDNLGVINMRRFHKSLTLIEILVVVTIIVLGLTMAVPSIQKFSAGQALENGGRVLQSAVNAARAAAITKNRLHYLICFLDNSGVGQDEFGFAVYEKGNKDGDGFNKIRIKLPPTLSISTAKQNESGLMGVVAQTKNGQIRAGCRLAVFEQMPTPDLPYFKDYFDNTLRDVKAPTGNKFTFLKFLPDGRAAFFGHGLVEEGGEKIYRLNGVSLFNPNKVFKPEDSAKYLRQDRVSADFEINQAGVDLKRCYVDIDANTGRARYRVVALHGSKAEEGTTTTGG